MVTVYAITVWAKFSKRVSPHFLFISLAAADFMEVSFAVSIHEKLVPLLILINKKAPQPKNGRGGLRGNAIQEANSYLFTHLHFTIFFSSTSIRPTSSALQGKPPRKEPWWP
jgi:hypothetical protein